MHQRQARGQAGTQAGFEVRAQKTKWPSRVCSSHNSEQRRGREVGYLDATMLNMQDCINVDFEIKLAVVQLEMMQKCTEILCGG